MKAAWARGRNYDISKLTLFTADPGFVLGESLLGVGKLGTRGADVALPAQFTSIQITSPTTVEQGLFVHRDVEICTLTATLPEMVDLKGKWVIIKYGTATVYEGKVAQVGWDESVDVGRDWLPGNTAVKTHRVTLTATAGDDVLATAPTPSRSFTNETLAQRITSWTGLPVTTQSPDAGVPLDWANAGWDTATVRRIVRTTDDMPSLLDTLRAETKLRNMTFLYQPRAAQPFVLKPNNQWLGSAAQPLVLTDDPAHPEGGGGDAFLHTGGYVSFTRRSIVEDPSLFPQSVWVRWGQYDVESPPGDGNPVDTVFGPYQLTSASPTEAVVDLGTIDVASPSTNNYRLARAVTQTLPVRLRPVPFTREVQAPLQSTAQLSGTVPGLALLQIDGVSEWVAVLGRQHLITPSKWLVSYTLGPPHLLTRQSQFDPPGVVTSAPTGTDPFFLHWTTPILPYALPSDVAIYEVFLQTTTAATPLITSDRSDVSMVLVNPAFPPGTVRSIGVSGAPSGMAWWVLYTSNPSPGSDNPSNLWREGQPTLLGVKP